MFKFFTLMIFIVSIANFGFAQDEVPPAQADPCEGVNCDEWECDELVAELIRLEEIKSITDLHFRAHQASVDSLQEDLDEADKEYENASRLYNVCVNNSQNPDVDCAALSQAVMDAFNTVEQLEGQLEDAKELVQIFKNILEMTCEQIAEMELILECCCG